MTAAAHSRREKYLLPLSLGIAEGIVNSLTLASSTVLHGRGLTLDVGLSVGSVALISAILTLFIAEYAQVRAGLARADRELNLTQSGRLAASHLGRQVATDASAACIVAGVASFAGAFLPPLVGAALSSYS